MQIPRIQLSCLAAQACLTLAACGATPAPAPSGPTNVGPGHVDAQLARGASTYQGVRKIKLRIRPDGAVEKFAVYHGEAAAVPEPVKALATARFPDAVVSHYEHERYADLGEVHEVEVRLKDGRACEISATPAGALVYEECELPVAEIPAPVKAAIDARLPGGKVVEIETKKGPTMDELSLEVEHEGKLHYLRLRPDGGLIAHFHRVPAEIDVPVP
jgi:hypothetical protein